MGILTKLTTDGSQLSEFDGQTPPNIATTPQSTLHYEYSINGNPNIPNQPSPSQLDLNGVTPPKYTDNLPG